MICQSCHENPATVHLTEIVQKTKRETHLCEGCAQSKGVSYKTQFSVKNFLSGLKPASEPEAQPAAEPKPAPQAEEPDFAPCAGCGIAFAEFRQSGRLGCAACYEHFAAGLMPLLEKIHSATQHTGRVPQRIGERLDVEAQLREQRELLQGAIDEEAYERAAELRDTIRALEGRLGGGAPEGSPA